MRWKTVVLAVLLLVVLLAASAWAQEDEFVIIPRSEVRQIIAELNRLRAELSKMADRLIGCQS